MSTKNKISVMNLNYEFLFNRTRSHPHKGLSMRLTVLLLSGKLIYQNAKTAFTRAADTAGINVHTTYGENIKSIKERNTFRCTIIRLHLKTAYKNKFHSTFFTEKIINII
jgi:hypothetical protein